MKNSRRWFLRVTFILVTLLIVVFFQVFNVSSNLFLLLSHEGELMIKEDNDWKKLSLSSNRLTLDTAFSTPGFSVKELSFARNHSGNFRRQVSEIFPGQIKIIEITPENRFMIVADPGSSFSPMNGDDAIKKSSANFVLNANFYGTEQQVMGELILDGIKYKEQSDASGFFRVIDNSPYVGPRSYINSIPGEIQYSCQAFPSVINQGEIFSYILTEEKPANPLWKNKTYRNLVGRKENGNIVFILSHQRGFLSVKEITQIAKIYGVDTASLFDGGRALQYSLDHPDYQLSFAAFNNTFSLGQRVDDYFLRKSRMTFVQKSPVFIGVKLI